MWPGRARRSGRVAHLDFLAPGFLGREAHRLVEPARGVAVQHRQRHRRALGVGLFQQAGQQAAAQPLALERGIDLDLHQAPARGIAMRLEQAGGPAMEPDDLRVAEVVTDARQMMLVVLRDARAVQVFCHGRLAQRQQERQIVFGGGLQGQADEVHGEDGRGEGLRLADFPVWSIRLYNCCAAGASGRPRREIRPRLRVTLGCSSSTLASVECPFSGMASRGTAATPSPASTRPSSVMTWLTS